MTTIFWDWNGTLLDDVAMAHRVTNEVFSALHYATLTLEEYRAAFRFPVIDYYRARGGKDEDFPRVAEIWSDAYLAAFPGCPLMAGAAQTVRELHEKGCRQLILSASKTENLRAQVAMYPELNGMFERLLGTGDIYAGGKTHVAQAYLAETGLDPQTVVMVGDSCHDAEVADAIGCRCVLIARGHQNDVQLQKAGKPILSDITQLPAFLREAEHAD